MADQPPKAPIEPGADQSETSPTVGEKPIRHYDPLTGASYWEAEYETAPYGGVIKFSRPIRVF